jgi:hypothetical protein
MDEFLNELYGTSQTITGDDLEKQAAAEFLVKLAEQEGVDLDTLSDAEVGSLLTEIEGNVTKQASAPQTDDGAQEKLAEADFLGRAMAHAYVNELHEIEKAAGIKETTGRAYQAVKGALGRASKGAGEWTGVTGMREAQKGMNQAGGDRKKLIEGIKTLASKGDKGTQSMRSLGKAQAESAKDVKTFGGLRSAYAKQFGKRVGLPAAGLAAAGGTAAALSGEKKSFDEQFETAARERAYEMLAEAGYDVEKVAQADIETRSLQMLEEAGYPVQWGQE